MQGRARACSSRPRPEPERRERPQCAALFLLGSDGRGGPPLQFSARPLGYPRESLVARASISRITLAPSNVRTAICPAFRWSSGELSTRQRDSSLSTHRGLFDISCDRVRRRKRQIAAARGTGRAPETEPTRAVRRLPLRPSPRPEMVSVAGLSEAARRAGRPHCAAGRRRQRARGPVLL